MRTCRKYINDYAAEIKRHVNMHREKSDDENHKFNMDMLVMDYKTNLSIELGLSEELIANYVIKTSYNSLSISKSFAWAGYGDYIIGNLKENTNPKRNISIREVPYKTNNSYEYLGKYYEFEVGDTYVRM